MAIIILLLKIWKTRSCSGISGKSQILFSVVYTARYLDLFTTFVSPYNSFMKVVFLATSYATLYLMYVKFKATNDRNHDTFRIEFLLVPVTLLALLVNHEFTPLEVWQPSFPLLRRCYTLTYPVRKRAPTEVGSVMLTTPCAPENSSVYTSTSPTGRRCRTLPLAHTFFLTFAALVQCTAIFHLQLVSGERACNAWFGVVGARLLHTHFALASPMHAKCHQSRCLCQDAGL